MNINDLQNGMTVKLKNGYIGIVMRNFMTWDYIIFPESASHDISFKPDQCTPLKNYQIVEVRSAKTYCNNSYLRDPKLMFERSVLKWKQEDEIIEMTVEQIEKLVGKKVKIIKG